MVVGDIGVSPAEATYITGFGLILPAAGSYSTTPLVVGKVYAPSYANPTPSNMSTAVSNMETAYTDAAGRTNPTTTELGAGNIGGMTLAPGLYKWGTSLTIPSNVTLSGSANDVWIFQIAGNLNISSDVKVILSGGAQDSNIFWQVAGQATLETTSVFHGNILSQTAIVLNTGAKLYGRALAQTAVTLDSNSVNIPVVVKTPATPAVPTVSSAIPATPAVSANSSSNNNSGGSVTYSNSLLTSQQQKQYDQLISTGVNSSNALKAVNLLSNPASISTLSASAFGQLVKIISKNLAQGGRGDDIKTLQQFLISQGKGSAAQALSKIGATTYFGALTRAALAEFQANVGINPALGNFGSITRAYLSSHY